MTSNLEKIMLFVVIEHVILSVSRVQQQCIITKLKQKEYIITEHNLSPVKCIFNVTFPLFLLPQVRAAAFSLVGMMINDTMTYSFLSSSDNHWEILYRLLMIKN